MSLLIQYALILVLLVQDKPVKIGLLVPDSSHTETIQSARKAIDDANRMGGYEGRSFELVVGTTEGPWGAGSKESVSLVYDHDVVAIVGSLDSRNAHLAEQVAAKSHLTYLETSASDPTLSQAFVPWFLRLVPNDKQSEALLKVMEKKGGGTIGILIQEDYETRIAVKSFTETALAKNGLGPANISVSGKKEEVQKVLRQIENAQLEHLLIPFYNEASLNTIALLKEKMPELHIYGTLAFTSGLDREDPGPDVLAVLDGMMMIYSYSKEQDSEYHRDITSLYAYDGVSLLVEAIRKGGLEGNSLMETLHRMKTENGLTGPISFDEKGNRLGRLHFIRIIRGMRVPLVDITQ